MGGRHLTTTAVAAGIGIAASVALTPFASAAVQGDNPAHTQTMTTAAAAQGTTREPDALPYIGGAAGFLLAGAGLIVIRRNNA
ncbi:hypothetical protein [Streptacidiphilus fuscans]|uniref:LPXTG cell wall anchor domain-containing protein n=1 Tax=Streptacidiphilus fuscans TaxID=2789292 RepID=A0A931AYA3_9ACTN|nr:hypothetical protein [Streptacidiphilus fuscans]MBF9067765.1 hypothetical protein [Streptacidiphilus fuscans]